MIQLFRRIGAFNNLNTLYKEKVNLLKKLRETDLPILHTLIYSSEKPRWTLYNAPYFDEYKQLNLETFLQSENHLFF